MNSINVNTIKGVFYNRKNTPLNILIIVFTFVFQLFINQK